jgi:hypothetical protein
MVAVGGGALAYPGGVKNVFQRQAAGADVFGDKLGQDTDSLVTFPDPLHVFVGEP